MLKLSHKTSKEFERYVSGRLKDIILEFFGIHDVHVSDDGDMSFRDARRLYAMERCERWATRGEFTVYVPTFSYGYEYDFFQENIKRIFTVLNSEDSLTLPEDGEIYSNAEFLLDGILLRHVKTCNDEKRLAPPLPEEFLPLKDETAAWFKKIAAVSSRSEYGTSEAKELTDKEASDLAEEYLTDVRSWRTPLYNPYMQSLVVGNTGRHIFTCTDRTDDFYKGYFDPDRFEVLGIKCFIREDAEYLCKEPLNLPESINIEGQELPAVEYYILAGKAMEARYGKKNENGEFSFFIAQFPWNEKAETQFVAPEDIFYSNGGIRWKDESFQYVMTEMQDTTARHEIVEEIHRRVFAPCNLSFSGIINSRDQKYK